MVNGSNKDIESLQAEFLRLRSETYAQKEEFRRNILFEINEELLECWHSNRRVATETLVREHGEHIHINYIPFEPLTLNEVSVELDGLSKLETRIGGCTKALKLVKKLEKMIIECNQRMIEFELELNMMTGQLDTDSKSE